MKKNKADRERQQEIDAGEDEPIPAPEPDGRGKRKREPAATAPLFPMTAAERIKAMRDAKAEYLESKQALDDQTIQLTGMKASHKRAEDRHDVARSRLLELVIDEAAS